MNYCLEMDLTCSNAARQIYYDMLNLLPEKRSQKELLTSNSKAIKKAERILSIIDTIPRSQIPESYSKIKNTILEDITNQCF